MNILTIEASTGACSVAVQFGEVCQENYVFKPKEHNQFLLSMVDELLSSVALSLSALDAIAYGAGPGSFTGLRLTAGVVQGLASAAKLPVIPISSMQALAYRAAAELKLEEKLTDKDIYIALDARMGELYVAAYRLSADGFAILINDRLSTATELMGLLAEEDLKRGILVGEGWQSDELKGRVAGSRILENLSPRAVDVLALAQQKLQAGEVLSAEQALPVYLREEVSWQKWQKKSQKWKPQ